MGLNIKEDDVLASLKDELMKTMGDAKKMKSLLPWRHKISQSEFFLLGQIHTLEEEHDTSYVYVSTISDSLQMSMPAVSQVLKTLEEKNCITRDVLKNDRRKVIVKTTQEGREIIVDAKKNLDRMISKMIYTVGEHDIHEFIRIINKMFTVAEQLTNEGNDQT